MKPRRALVALAVMAVAVAACDSGEVALTVTSTLVTGPTQPPPSSTTTTTSTPMETSTTLRGEVVAAYEVIVREPTDNGVVLYILIPPGAYTDVDLENFISDLRDRTPDLWGVEVFDDAGVVDALPIPEDQRTEEQQQLLDDHHFVSLVNGDILRFQGPFSDLGEYVIGS